MILLYDNQSIILARDTFDIKGYGHVYVYDINLQFYFLLK